MTSLAMMNQGNWSVGGLLPPTGRENKNEKKNIKFWGTYKKFKIIKEKIIQRSNKKATIIPYYKL